MTLLCWLASCWPCSYLSTLAQCVRLSSHFLLLSPVLSPRQRGTHSGLAVGSSHGPEGEHCLPGAQVPSVAGESPSPQHPTLTLRGCRIPREHVIEGLGLAAGVREAEQRGAIHSSSSPRITQKPQSCKRTLGELVSAAPPKGSTAVSRSRRLLAGQIPFFRGRKSLRSCPCLPSLPPPLFLHPPLPPLVTVAVSPAAGKDAAFSSTSHCSSG